MESFTDYSFASLLGIRKTGGEGCGGGGHSPRRSKRTAWKLHGCFIGSHLKGWKRRPFFLLWYFVTDCDNLRIRLSAETKQSLILNK